MEKRFGISGAALKRIAILTMTIDHIGAVIIQRFMVTQGFDRNFWEMVYWPFRYIGRIAFPIFCFLLVEGYTHTKNKKKYLFRMVLFAILSELPFNLAVGGKILDFRYQNVFWELSLGILLMMILEKIERQKGSRLLKWSLMAAAVLPGIWAAETLHFDYGEHGIITIMVLYFFRYYRSLQLTAGALTFLWSWRAMLGFLPVALYNGKRGRQIKYVFYIFYPSHLLLFYAVARLVGCTY